MGCRSKSTHVSGSVTTRPSTRTAPPRIQATAWVRDPQPSLEQARCNCTRRPGAARFIATHPPLASAYEAIVLLFRKAQHRLVLVHPRMPAGESPMPTNIECPTCKTALEISAELMGKKIKCPECKTIFTATIGETAGSTTSEAEVRIRRKPPTPSNEDAKYEEDQEEQEEETIRVRKRSIRQRDEDVEEYEEDEDDEEEELSRRRRRRLASPRRKA